MVLHNVGLLAGSLFLVRVSPAVVIMVSYLTGGDRAESGRGAGQRWVSAERTHPVIR